ncbi:MAG: DCC1-like thiol-disulfide oxidoreductase family protein [Pseudomonadota bacterium]
MRPESKTAFSFREDSDVPAFDHGKIHLVMDAECALCTSAARRIARLDKHDVVRIAPAQSPLGRALLLHYGMTVDNPESWLLIENGQAWGSLDAIIRLFPRLHRGYSFLWLVSFLPNGLQDWLYARIARNRYSLFGRADMCALPDAALQAKLVR